MTEFDTEDSPQWKPEKPKGEKIKLDGLQFDSMEEVWFYWQLLELRDAGLVRSVERSETFTLAPPLKISCTVKNKLTERELIKGQTYTPDFKIRWIQENEAVKRVVKRITDPTTPMTEFLTNSDWTSYFEVKPAIERSSVHGRDAEIRVAQANRKWLMSTRRVFVQLVYIGAGAGFFPKTFTPAQFMLTDVTKKPRRINYDPILSIQDWLTGATH